MHWVQWSGVVLARVADAFGQGPGALASDFDEAGIVGDLVEGAEGALRLGKQLAVELGLELEEGVIDAEAVVFHAALEQHQELLLAGEALEDLKELTGGSAEGVIEFCFVGLCVFFPAEGLLSKVGYFAMDVEVLALEMVEFAGQFKHFGAERCAHFELQFFGIFVELADVVSGLVGVFADGDFDELGGAGFEDAAEGELGGGGSGKWRSRIRGPIQGTRSERGAGSGGQREKCREDQQRCGSAPDKFQVDTSHSG